MTAPSTPDRELQVLFALSSGKPGRGHDYERWYETRHLPDMKSVPGVKGGQFYRAAPAGGRWDFCGRFQMTRPNVDVMTDMVARAGTPAMPLTDALDPSKTLFVDATAQGSEPTAPGADSGALLVLGSEHSVSDDELSAWRRVPGVCAVHAFSLAGAIGNWISPWRTLILCDIRTGQGSAALSALASASERWGAPQDANYVGLFERVG
jgi:hypothetical protein